MKESEFHEWLKKAVPPAEGAVIGIGDDAAVLAASGPIAVATDLLVENIHFRVGEASGTQIGAKAVNRNFSDMAAMGLAPHWVLVSAAIPEETPDAFLLDLVSGMVRAAGVFGAGIVGGDTSGSMGGLVIDVVVLGKTEGLKPITRSGARPGDRILVTGALGGSSLGKHLTFLPRVAEGLFLNRKYGPTAMIDISDGLALDLSRLLDASRAGAIIDGSRIPVSEAARTLGATTGRPPLEHALSDGEDFELLFTLPPDRAEQLLKDRERSFAVSDLGAIDPDPLVRSILLDGALRALGREGYDHRI